MYHPAGEVLEDYYPQYHGTRRSKWCVVFGGLVISLHFTAVTRNTAIFPISRMTLLRSHFPRPERFEMLRFTHVSHLLDCFYDDRRRT